MLAEMAQQQRAATLDRLDQRAQRIEPRPLARDARLGQLSQPHPRPREILGAPQHPLLRGVALPPPTSRFLIIALARLRPPPVPHDTHLRLLDPHPACNPPTAESALP